jgi:nucleoside-diphosphate-sugar epimerase
MRILITGASSFVGAHFARLAALDHQVIGLHHQTALALNGVTPIRCDLSHPAALQRLEALKADVVVHLACKVMGPKAPVLGRRMMDVVLALGLPVLYASSTMVHWPVDVAYANARREDESRLVASGLDHAILRPCAPYGPRLLAHTPRHTESFHTLANLVRRSPIVPIPGDGKYRRQPIHVEDFCRAGLALVEGGLKCQALDAGGGDALSMNDLVRTLGTAMGRNPRILHLPGVFNTLVGRFRPELDPDLLNVFDTDDVADPTAMTAATGVVPRCFADGAVDLAV